MNKIINYIKINDSVSTAGQPTEAEFKTIADEGFEVIINLAMHNKSALPEEDKIVSKNGMVYIHIPIDWERPEKERLVLFYEIFSLLQQKNKKVFMHCILNYRVSVFLYMYKKEYLKDESAILLAPKDFKPNVVWKAFMENKDS